MVALVEDVGDGDTGLVHRHVREWADPRRVADRPQPVTGAHPLVDLDRLGLRVQAHRVDADSGPRSLAAV